MTECLYVSSSESLNVSLSHRLNAYVHCRLPRRGPIRARRPCMALRARVTVARPSTCTPASCACSARRSASTTCAVDIRATTALLRTTCPFRPQVWAHRTIDQPLLPSLRSWRTPYRECPGRRNGHRARAGHAQPASPRARAREGEPVRQRAGLHAARALHRGCDGAKVRGTLGILAPHVRPRKQPSAGAVRAPHS